MNIQNCPGKYPKHSKVPNWKVPVTISETPTCEIRNDVSVPHVYSQQATSFHLLRSCCTIHSNPYCVLRSACLTDKYSAISFGTKISTELQHEILSSHYLAFSALL